MQRSLKWGLWLALFILAADALSKFWINQSLPIIHYHLSIYPYGGIPVFQNFFGVDFSIDHLINTGAAWGSFGNYQDALILLRCILIAAMLIYLLFFNQNNALQISLCLVIAGALGNVIDYFLYGHVIDMLHFVFWGYHFPVFNIADSAVCLGVVGLIIITTWQDRKCRTT